MHDDKPRDLRKYLFAQSHQITMNNMKKIQQKLIYFRNVCDKQSIVHTNKAIARDVAPKHSLCIQKNQEKNRIISDSKNSNGLKTQKFLTLSKNTNTPCAPVGQQTTLHSLECRDGSIRNNMDIN